MRKSLSSTIATTSIFGTAAILALVTPTPSEALKRGSYVDITDCLENSSDHSCGGAICSCCFSDGCWICNNEYKDCTWDPAYKRQKGTTGVSSPPAGIKPPSSKPPKGSIGNAPPPAGAQDR